MISEVVAALVRDFLVPGSDTFLLLGLIVGVGLLFVGGRRRRWGRNWLAALTAFYFVLSTPFGANLLAAGLERNYPRIEKSADAGGATAIVLLSGGSLTYRTTEGEINSLGGQTAFRTLEAARIYSVMDEPWLLVSAGASENRDITTAENRSFETELIAAGVPSEKIVFAPGAADTYVEAINLEPIVEAYAIERLVLVTSPGHMWRALRTFRARGFDVVPGVAVRQSIDAAPRPALLPHSTALRESRSNMREYLAIVYFWSRGWLSGP